MVRLLLRFWLTPESLDLVAPGFDCLAFLGIPRPGVTRIVDANDRRRAMLDELLRDMGRAARVSNRSALSCCAPERSRKIDRLA